ncbi:formamidopyrimidine-DNA glycosylase [Aureococcus anophagefferens]|uniref:Formamidopyrimidine-DNA glycosylase n=1 Tax=Aureococcus anophagefferens TaxID=44056 RepID=A0ABR1FN25_AURAN
MSGGWTLRAGHPHARLALRLASDDDEARTGSRGARRAARSPEKKLAVFLMDQKQTAGIGNYLLSEILSTRARGPSRPWETSARTASAPSAAKRCGSSARRATRSSSPSYGTPDPRPKLRDLAPLGFSLEVYGASVAGDGRAVRRDAGPHGRTLHWVEEAQTGAMPDSDEAAPPRGARAARATRPRRWRGPRSGSRPPAASAGSASPARRPSAAPLTGGS